MKSLLFVCSGNLHRSVMAAALMDAILQQAGHPANIGSAGTLGLTGRRSPQEVHDVLGELGLDVSDHLSRPLSRSLIDVADAVIVMEDRHGDIVLDKAPHAEDKIIYLGDYMAQPGDVADPIGGSEEVFRESRDRILAALQALLPRLLTQLGLRR